MSRKTVNQTDVYTRITNQIITDLEKGVKTWTKPWRAAKHRKVKISWQSRH